MNKGFTIGELAKLTDVPPKTIRYYEDEGILPAPRRSESRYRLYTDVDVRRLELVRRARLLDMSLAEARELVEWASTEKCEDFQGRFLEVVRRKLQEVDRRIADLSHLKEDLQRLEAHFIANGKEVSADHTVLECSPETCTCLGADRENQNREAGGCAMAGQTKVEEMTAPESKQDCGCGCGGASCGSATQDCGCGCGGSACESVAREVVLVGALAGPEASGSGAQECDCGCECCG